MRGSPPTLINVRLNIKQLSCEIEQHRSIVMRDWMANRVHARLSTQWFCARFNTELFSCEIGHRIIFMRAQAPNHIHAKSKINSIWVTGNSSRWKILRKAGLWKPLPKPFVQTIRGELCARKVNPEVKKQKTPTFATTKSSTQGTHRPKAFTRHVQPARPTHHAA